MKLVSCLLLPTLLAGCIAGPPQLNYEQYKKAGDMKIFKVGTTPEMEFKLISEVDAADCSGPGGSRLYGDEGKALDILKMKTAAMGGDAIVNVSCAAAPFVNNCWAAKKCEGTAVSWK
ncbi:MAG: hypothetical protein JWR68_3248 [Polaromonas sp.]|nr:hypothetical protein [Polaromonas sp.]